MIALGKYLLFKWGDCCVEWVTCVEWGDCCFERVTVALSG